MKNPLEASDTALANFLTIRRGAICTMCNTSMPDGFCIDPACETYPESLGNVFIERFESAMMQIHSWFTRKVPVQFVPSRVVSGGQVESKRRKH